MWMGSLLALTGFGAVLAPLLLFLLLEPFWEKRWLRAAIVAAYAVVILYYTVMRREIGSGQYVALVPFQWLQRFDQVDVRWQYELNVFLFIPFGFLLAWMTKRSFWQTVLIAFLLSASVETAQYFFAFGYCETDDMLCNTLGAVLGYGEWKAAVWLNRKLGQN